MDEYVQLQCEDHKRRETLMHESELPLPDELLGAHGRAAPDGHPLAVGGGADEYTSVAVNDVVCGAV